MIVMIDNYCSFTYNQVHLFGDIGVNVKLLRNDAVSLEDIIALNPEKLIVSSGPCTPNEAGVSLDAIKHFAGKIPILGICLGHQAIGQAFGGKVVHSKQIMHGKTSLVYHNGKGVFKNIDSPFTAVRYHSLAVEKESLPGCFEITAWTENEDGSFDEIMGIKHKEFAIEGVQYHPESLCSEFGLEQCRNFLKG